MKFIPVALLTVVVFFLWMALDLNPNYFNSNSLDKTVPKFQLPYVNQPNQMADESLFKGRVSLLTVWASWCNGCQSEHPELIKIAQSVPELLLVGVNFHDHLKHAAHFLNVYENPFHHALFDHEGRLSIDLGVTGLPETFLIDKKGVIRYRHEGIITTQVWLMVLRPKVLELVAEK